jgi:hypothetical protein
LVSSFPIHTFGAKDRPCAIILAVDEPAPNTAQRKQVAVAPITHSPPRDMSVAVEIPPRVKEHLGLDKVIEELANALAKLTGETKTEAIT